MKNLILITILLISAFGFSQVPVTQQQLFLVNTGGTPTPPTDTINKILLFTKTASWDHQTREEATALLTALSTTLNFELTVDNVGTEFDDQTNLNQYDIIFFSNTTGDFLTSAQRARVEVYAAQGGNFIGNHGSADCYGHSSSIDASSGGAGTWDWYAENVSGASQQKNPSHTTSSTYAATLSLVNNTSLTNGITFPLADTDEWYYWEKGYIDSKFTELFEVSSTGSGTWDAPRMMAQYWSRPNGGKSLYTGLGHSESKYSDTEFVQLISNFINYCLGNLTIDEQAPTAPTSLVSSNPTINTVNLNWTASTDNVDVVNYLLYNSSNVNVLTFGAVTSGVVTGLTASTTYTGYYLRARDSAGNLSANSNTVSFTTETLDDSTNFNLPDEVDYFAAYLYPLEGHTTAGLQSAIDTYGSVRLESGDYGRGSGDQIVLTSNQKVYGHNSITKTPNFVIAEGSTGVEIHNVNCGFAGTGIGITFEAGDPITNVKLRRIDFTPIRATGAKIEDCEFIGFRNTEFLWNMSASGYFRNNKFTRHTLQNSIGSWTQHSFKGNDVTPSYGNAFVAMNYLTPSSRAVEMDNVDDVAYVGIDLESWNWANQVTTLAAINITNAGSVKISNFQGGTKTQTVNLPAYHIEADATFTSKMTINSFNEDNVIEGNSIVVNGGDSDYLKNSIGEDLRVSYNTNLAMFNGVDQTTTITDTADIDSLTSVLLTPEYTPWTKPTRVTLPNPTGSNWATNRIGQADDHAYIQNLINTGSIVFLPEGIYYISEPLVFPMNKGILGEGTGKTVIVAMTDDFPIIKVTHDVAGLGSKTGGLTVANITLQGGSKGIQFTSNADPNAPVYPGTAYFSDCFLSNIVFRDNVEGINTYNIYGLDNNYFERLYFVNNSIGIHQEPYVGSVTWTSPVFNFMDKTFFNECEFINNDIAVYFDAELRPNNLNGLANCVFDGCGVVAWAERENTGLIVNSVIRNTVGTQPLAKGGANFAYIGCLFEDNDVPYYFQAGALLDETDLLDAIPLFSGAGANQLYATNSTIMGTVPNKDGAMGLVNTLIPNEPTWNKMIAVKSYLGTLRVILNQTPTPYPQLLVTH